MVEFHDVIQNLEPWFELRAGHLTGSGFSKIMATPREYIVVCTGKDEYAIANTTAKKVMKPRYRLKIDAERALADMLKKDLTKAFGDPAKQYAINIAVEQLTDTYIESTYSNDHMQRGHEQEPEARFKYEDKYFCDMTNGGFFDAGFVGVSPDGVVDDGLTEIKSVIPHVHLANIKRQSVDPSYKWQHIGNMKFAEKQWIDFISYCADFPEDKQLYVYRLYAKDCQEEYAMMDSRIAQFKQLVDESKVLILNSNYSVY